MFIKDNHPTLRQDIERLFARAGAGAQAETEVGTEAAGLRRQRVQALGDESGLPPPRCAETWNLGHGRIEWRHLQTLSVPSGVNWLEWPECAQVFAVRRQSKFKKSGQPRGVGETVYGLTNLEAGHASPERLLGLCRGHWSIENRSHWVRDVTFDEDRSTVRRGSLPQIMAALRNAVIGLMRLAGHTNIAAACRRHAARPHEVLPLLGFHSTFE